MRTPESGKTVIANRIALTGLAIFALMFLSQPSSAQRAHARGNPGNAAEELVRTETGFFEAWKKKDDTYFRTHMLENGIFWSDSGTLSRDQQLQQQQTAAKACTVEGYGLSDFGVLPLTGGAYLLTYKAEEYATCGGEKLPVHWNGSSIYVLKEGRWQAIYRAQVPLKNQH